LNYLIEVGGEPGKKPISNMFKVLTEKAANDPWNCPSPYVIAKRVTGGKEIGPAIEEAGFVYVPGWEKPQYEEWGAMFMEANDGTELIAFTIHWLSTQKLGPSRDAIIGEYGSIAAFKKAVLEKYQTKQQETLGAQIPQLSGGGEEASRPNRYALRLNVDKEKEPDDSLKSRLKVRLIRRY
jgi:hypothetical protein